MRKAKLARLIEGPARMTVTVVDHPLVQHKLTIMRDKL